jgi:hypothetical protein
MWRNPRVLARAAPRRLLREPATSALTLAALVLTGLAAAAGPLYAEASADASLRTVLRAVPERAPADVAAVVRVSGGRGPTRPDLSGALDQLAEIPGLGDVAYTGVSVSPELLSSSTQRVSPVVQAGTGTGTGDGVDEAVRLFAVPDPTAHLRVEPADRTARGGVWLPEPLASRLGADVGSSVSLVLDGGDGARTLPVTVAGTYAVLADGRTPRPPDGDRLWAAVHRSGFPRDGLDQTQVAQLVIADVATTARMGRRIRDDLLWTAEARVDESRPSLQAFHDTAGAVDDLRGRVALLPVGLLGDALQPLVASGIEELDDDASALASAAQRGTALAGRVGVLVGLLLTVAAAAFLVGRRRRELALVAGNGARPAGAAGLLVLELLPLGVVAWLLSWWTAGPVVDLVVAGGRTPRASVDSAEWAAAACTAALACCGAVAALAVVREQRRLRGHRAPRVPWRTTLVVGAGAAVAGLLGRPDRSVRTLGVLDLLVPVLVVGAVTVAGSRLAWLALRRTSSTTRRPRGSTVALWLAARRLRADDPVREATTALAATGLALLIFSLAALASLEASIADRSAVAAGAVSRYGLSSSWELDDDAPRSVAIPQDTPILAPVPIDQVPRARTPPLPVGQSVVWHGDASLAASEVRLRLLVIDPYTFARAADWGSTTGAVRRGRALLPQLATRADDVAAQVRAGETPAVPALLVGDPDDERVAAIAAIGVIETGRLRLTVDVQQTLTGFPGSGSGTPLLVLPEDPTFALAGNDDPRLRPPLGSGGLVDRFLPGVFPELWSDRAEAAVETLARHDVPQRSLPGIAQLQVEPLYVAGLQSRRFQVALGVLFALLGLLAATAAAMQRARRTPAADVMVSWSGGTRGRTARQARDVEVVAGLVLTALLAWVAVQALRPLAPLLVDPGDGRPPASDFTQPLSLLVLALGWLVVTLLAALAGGRLAGRTTTDVEALRGED